MAKCPVCNTEMPDTSKFCSECGYSITGAKTGKLNPDTVLENRYIVVKTLGRGGMGAVYLALDTRLNNTPVAIKEMSTRAVGGDLQKAITAFKKEASMLRNLQHPALPRMNDFFSQGEDRWYLVMDHIEGQTLKELVDKRGPIPEAEVLNWARQLCAILDYLHQQDPPIIFRDLKPANIMLTPEGQIKLIDFGIARHFQQGSTTDTNAYGSNGFAPPEQYGETQTDPRSDIFALGATLHYLLTGIDPGKTPFIFESPRQTVKISPRLDTAVMKALELKAENRPGGMQEMLKLLPMGAVRPVAGPVRNTTKPNLADKDTNSNSMQYLEQNPAAPTVSAMSSAQTTPLSIDSVPETLTNNDNEKAKYPAPQILDVASAADQQKKYTGTEQATGNKILFVVGLVIVLMVGIMVYSANSQSGSTTPASSSYSELNSDSDSASDSNSESDSEITSGEIVITGQDGDEWQYNGPISDDMANGSGTAVCTQGGGNYEVDDKYTGDFVDNKRSGQGAMNWSNGDAYTGQWEDDQQNGQGTQTYSSGDTYEGEWQDGTYNGQGTYTWADSGQYIGEWQDGIKTGQGTRTWADGDKYIGEWQNDNCNGQGTYIFPDGETQEGEWKDGSKVGQGTITWTSGEKYVGGWSNEGRSGWGTNTYPDGSYYTGGWQNDQKYGQGNWYNSDGSFNSWNPG